MTEILQTHTEQKPRYQNGCPHCIFLYHDDEPGDFYWCPHHDTTETVYTGNNPQIDMGDGVWSNQEAFNRVKGTHFSNLSLDILKAIHITRVLVLRQPWYIKAIRISRERNLIDKCDADIILIQPNLI